MTTAAGALEAAIDAVVGADLAALSVAQLQSVVVTCDRAANRLTAYAALASATLDARVAGRLPTEDGRSRSVAGWVAEATTESPSTAGRMIRLGTQLQGALPEVAAAALDGRIGWEQAEVLTRLVGKIDADSLREAEPSLVVAAERLDPISLGRFVQHQLATWVEPVVEDAEARAVDRRYLKTRTEPDGSLWGSFRIAPGDSEALRTVIEAGARKQGLDDIRSAAQRRADALVDTVEQVLRHGELGDHGGQRPQISYVLPADWAARQHEQACCSDCRPCPQHQPKRFADVVGAGVPGADLDRDPGVIPAEHACAVAAWSGPQTRARMEALLCDARITRVLLSPLGQVRGLESLSDSVTPAQRRALAARDLGCAVRGCTRPPAMCDAHHLTARKDGGASTMRNLVLLCRRHHVLWHLGKIDLRALHVPWLSDGPQSARPPDPESESAPLVGADSRPLAS